MKYQCIAIALMALVTYLPRVLPMAVFRKEIQSRYIKSVLYYIPYAVLASLTFPDIFSSTSDFISALSGTLTAIVLAYMEKSLVIVAVGAMLAAFLPQLL